jgi:hypothetical protein
VSDLQRLWSTIAWSDVVTLVVLALVVWRAVLAIRGYLYVRDVYAGRSEDVSEMGRLVQRDRIIAWCSVALVGLGTWSLLNFSWPERIPPVPRPFGTLFIFVVVWVMTRGPIEDRRAWRKLRGEA